MTEIQNKKNFTFLSQEEVDALLIHALFAAICGIVLLIPTWIAIGLRLTFLVIVYLIIVPLVGKVRGYPHWIDLWLFTFILSLFQIFPDWFLSAQLDVVVFPDSFLKIGTVSIYMAGLWTIPLFLITFIGLRTKERMSEKFAYFVVSFISLIFFGISEEFLGFIWYAQNVVMIDHIAIYIIIPEILLGLTTYHVYYKWVKGNSFLEKVLWAFILMIFYFGNASFFYFIFEKFLSPILIF